MSMSWHLEDATDHWTLVALAGRITEDTDFRELERAASARRLRLDLAGVEQVNSCGVREWIHFVSRLGRDGRQLELSRCSPAIVRQLNMVSNFRGTSRVHSVLLPYYCESCGAETSRSLELTDAPLQVPDTVPCARCQAPAEFDDFPESYLAFSRAD